MGPTRNFLSIIGHALKPHTQLILTRILSAASNLGVSSYGSIVRTGSQYQPQNDHFVRILSNRQCQHGFVDNFKTIQLGQQLPKSKYYCPLQLQNQMTISQADFGKITLIIFNRLSEILIMLLQLSSWRKQSNNVQKAIGEV